MPLVLMQYLGSCIYLILQMWLLPGIGQLSCRLIGEFTVSPYLLQTENVFNT